MTQTLTEYHRYISDFETLETSRDGATPDWLNNLRRRAIERFREIGLPTARKGNEPWKYTNVAPIADKQFATSPAADGRVELPAAVPQADDWRTLVFVNSRYAPQLSKPGADVVARSLREVLRADAAGLEKHLGGYASWDDDGFTALNTAFIDDGAVIELTSETEIAEPIHIVYVSTDTSPPSVSFPRTLVIAGPHSKASIIETYVSAGSATNLTNAVTEIILQDGAQIEHERVMIESHASFHIGRTRVYQGRDTSFSSLTFEAGSALGRNDFSVLLDGEGGECNLNGLYVTSGDQHIDNYLNIDHAKPHAKSRLYYKGILDDKSRAVFGGMVLVREGAIKTNAHQEDKNLLLSDEAEVDSKPSLEIYADDVVCGHGATAGAVADEALFYMRSRGLDDETAQVLLVKGFASEILERVSNDSLREHLEKLTLAALPRFPQSMGDDDD